MASVERALGYPYTRRPGSFVFAGSRSGGCTFDVASECMPWELLDNNERVGTLLVEHDGSEVPLSEALEGMGWSPSLDTNLSELTPVIAVGSNSSNEQIQRKFSEHTDALVLAFGAFVYGVDSVFAAELTWYGSISATMVEASPDTCFYSTVTLLNERTLERMDQTERAYHMFKLPEVEIVPVGKDGSACTRQSRSLYCYVHKRGAVLGLGELENEPVALKEVQAFGRQLGEKSQREIQHAAMQRLGCDGDGKTVEQFVQQNIDDEELRSNRVAKLAERTLHFHPRHLKYEHVA